MTPVHNRLALLALPKQTEHPGKEQGRADDGAQQEDEERLHSSASSAWRRRTRPRSTRPPARVQRSICTRASSHSPALTLRLKVLPASAPWPRLNAKSHSAATLAGVSAPGHSRTVLGRKCRRIWK